MRVWLLIFVSILGPTHFVFTFESDVNNGTIPSNVKYKYVRERNLSLKQSKISVLRRELQKLVNKNNLFLNLENPQLGNHNCLNLSRRSFELSFLRREIGRVKLLGATLLSVPRCAITMTLAYSVIKSGAKGDFLDIGLGQGGSIFLLLRTLFDFDSCGKKVYGFDSFEGLPATTLEDHAGENFVGKAGSYRSSEQTFLQNLRTLVGKDRGKLSTHVLVAKGWFNETFKVSPVQQISFLRIDADLYSSTWDALMAFYDRVTAGGIIYVDDYGSFNGCAVAVDKFRTLRKIYEPLHYVQETRLKGMISFEAVWWQKRLS